MIKPTRAALLRAVADAIIASGYAVPVQSKRRYIRRSRQIAELAQDVRIRCAPHSPGNVALIDDAERRYRVSRINARKMVRQARKMRHEAESRRPC